MPSSQIDLIIADLTKFTEGRMVALGLEVTANLREDTPRDTGWARANWVPAIGSPAPGPDERTGRPTPGEVSAALSRASQGEASLNSYDLEQGSIFVSNGVPYIVPLNEGSSAQAGSGFVQASAERAVRSLS